MSDNLVRPTSDNLSVQAARNKPRDEACEEPPFQLM
jgi:hypothetical protein